MSQGVWVLVAALALATAFGTYRALRDGRFRGTHAIRTRAAQPHAAQTQTAQTQTAQTQTAQTRAAQRDGAQQPAGTSPHETPAPSLLADTDIDHQLGERATLLQFSSAFCAPCRATRRILADVATVVPGVEHVEVDAEHHLDLVRRVGILRTPTTLILDRYGHEVSRATGAPRKDEVIATLGRALEV